MSVPLAMFSGVVRFSGHAKVRGLKLPAWPMQRGVMRGSSDKLQRSSPSYGKAALRPAD